MPRPPRARSSPCWVPTAPARRRPWRSSRATERPTAAWCACSASTHGATRAGCARGSASCSNAPSCTARSASSRRSASSPPSTRRRSSRACSSSRGGWPGLPTLAEPTAAMDVTARRSTWELLRALRSEGATILLTTHLLEEAEALADRVAIIDAGRLVGLGTPAELRAPPAGREGATHRSVRLELIGPLSETDAAALGRLVHVGGVRRPRDGVYSLATGSPGELLVELSAWLWAK